MKWNKTKIEKLECLINKNKRPDEIIKELGVTKKALSLKMNRLGLKIKYKNVIKCVNCGNEFENYSNINSKFCSNSCSAKHTNKNRKLTDETKQKIKNSLMGFFNNKPKKVTPNIPLNTAVPNSCRDSAPAPVAITKGNTPMIKANEVIKMGRNLIREASTAASKKLKPFSCRRLANSTIKIAFLLANPTRTIKPI